MDKARRAKLVLVEIGTIEDGGFEGNTKGLLILVNEALRNAKELAQETLATEEAELKVG